MTERWRAELSRLPRLDDPTSAWHRTSTLVGKEPPPQLPPTRQRIAAAVVALAVFAGAGVLAYSAFDSDGTQLGGPAAPEPVVVHLSSGDGTSFDPSAFLVYDDRKADTCAGWFVVFPDGSGEAQDMLCRSTTSPLEVPVGSPFLFETGGDAVTTQVEPADATVAPGEKTIRILASWAPTELWTDAGAEFHVNIEVIDTEGQRPATTSPEPPRTTGSNVLEIHCREDRAPDVLTPVVDAQRDGLHFVASASDTDEPLLIFFDWPNHDGGLESGVTEVGSEGVLPLAPGDMEVACLPGGGSPVYAPFELADPHGYFRPPTLECGSDPTVVVTHQPRLRDIWRQPGDVLEPFGYDVARDDLRHVVVRRDGRAIAWVLLFAGGSILNGEACAGSGFPTGASDP